MQYNRNKVESLENRMFADRVEPRKLFWDTYTQFQDNMKDSVENEIKVITYYGIGGIGKSRLLKELVSELNANISLPIYISVDLEKNTDKLKALKNMRNQLKVKNDKFVFPIFDLALYTYLKKQGENVSSEEIQTIITSNPILASIFDIGSTAVSTAIPLVGLAASVIKGVDHIVASVRSNILSRRKELYEIENEEPDILLNNLQYYLANDIEDNLKNQTKPLVVFFDTYEVLVNELNGVGDPLDKDEWIRDEKKGLVVNMPNTIWVIAGRDKLKWDVINPDWASSMEQTLLGDLSEADTKEFLANAGVSDVTLADEIYKLTGGTPIYLDICIDRYNSIVENGETPTIKEIGSNTDDMIRRFVKYMDDNIKDILNILSCIDEWNKALLEKVVAQIKPGFSYTTLKKIESFSFIQTEDNETYKMHQAVRKVINKYCSESFPKIAKQTIQLMETHLLDTLNQTSESDTEYVSIVKRYIFYNLRNGYDTEEEFDQFLKGKFSEFKKNLKKRYLFKEACYLSETVLDYSEGRFGSGKVTAWVQYDYSRSLKRAGSIKKALEHALLAYNYYKDNPQKVDSGTPEIIRNLVIIYGMNGESEKSLRLAQEAYDLSISLLGNEHPESIEATRRLAISHSMTGSNDRSLILMKEAYGLGSRILGRENPKTIEMLKNLSISYALAGDRKKALKLAEEAYELSAKVLGDEDPVTIDIMKNLAISYRKAGDKAKEMILSQKVLQLRLKIYGEEHPKSIDAYGNLAISFNISGNYNEAINLFTKALELSTDVLGEEHPKTLERMRSLIIAYLRARKTKEALQVSENLLETCTAIYGAGDSRTIGVIQKLMKDYFKSGEKENAIKLSEKQLKICIDSYGEENPNTIRMLKYLIDIYSEAGEINRRLRTEEKLKEIT